MDFDLYFDIRRHLDNIRTRRSCKEDKADVPELIDTLLR